MSWSILWDRIREKSFRKWKQYANIMHKFKKCLTSIQRRYACEKWRKQAHERTVEIRREEKIISFFQINLKRKAFFLLLTLVKYKKRLANTGEIIQIKHNHHTARYYWEKWEGRNLKKQKSQLQNSIASSFYINTLKKKGFIEFALKAENKKQRKVNKNLAAVHYNSLLIRKAQAALVVAHKYFHPIFVASQKVAIRINRKLGTKIFSLWKDTFAVFHRASSKYSSTRKSKSILGLSKW